MAISQQWAAAVALSGRAHLVLQHGPVYVKIAIGIKVRLICLLNPLTPAIAFTGYLSAAAADRHIPMDIRVAQYAPAGTQKCQSVCSAAPQPRRLPSRWPDMQRLRR